MDQESDNKDLGEQKDMKVSIPVWQHLLLHELKVLTERNISETVQGALTHEFERLAAQDDSPVSPKELQGEVENLAAPDEE